MHQRIFYYAMVVYAFGFVAALTLNFDIYDQTARAPDGTTEPKVSSVASSAVIGCAHQPDVHVVASAPPSSLGLEQVASAPDCAHRILEVVPVPSAATSKSADIPVEGPLVPQDL